jgi:GT2 family glycosyltransferase
MLASVIICTHNRARLLERTLRSLAWQTEKAERFEIIVIDDGSSDGTAGLVAGMRRDLSNMTCVSLAKHLGLAGAANVGIRAAKGEFFLFTDDDCLAQEDWVERLTASLAQEPIVAGAMTSPVSGYNKLCHNISQFHRFMNPGRSGEIASIAGANMGIRRSVLQEFGGFDERSKTPDMEFMLRARSRGYRVHFAPRAVVLHDPDRTNLVTILRYSSEHASETILLRNRYRSLLKSPFVLRSPGLILMAAPLIALVATLQIYGNNVHLARYFWTAPLVYLQKLAWCWGAAHGLAGQSGKRANATDCPGEEKSRRS